MEFDPETGGMKCRFCGHTEALPGAAPGQGGAAMPPPQSETNFWPRGAPPDYGRI